MLEFLRRHKHLYAIVAPSLVCLAVIIFTIPTFTGPIKFFEANYILTLTDGQATWDLRLLPVLAIYLLILLIFFLLKPRGLKRATIAMLVAAAVLSVAYRIVFLPVNQETSLSEITSVVEQLSEEDLPVVVSGEVPAAVNFYIEPAQLDALMTEQPSGFWYLTGVESQTAEFENYQVTNEASNKYYHVMRFERGED